MMAFRLHSSDILFPVPLLVFDDEEGTARRQLLAQEILERRQREQSLDRSNRGGWHSRSDFMQRAEPAHRDLAGSVLGALRAATEAVAPTMTWEKIDLQVEGWVNISEIGDYHAPHDHPSSFWSAVYYVEAGGGGDGGEIEFLSGRACVAQALMLSVPMSWDYFRVQAQPGRLLVFPSHLKHWVTPLRVPGPRISVAFNATLVPKSQP